MSMDGFKTVEEGGKQRFVLAYQARDTEGNAIGSPTHLEADSMEELLEKQRTSYEHAVRLVAQQNKYISDLKRRTPKPKAAEPTFQPKQLTPEETVQATLELQNPKTIVSATRKLVEAAVPIGDIEKVTREAQVEKARALGERAAYAFMQRHLEDYLPCDANNKLVTDYLTQNSLDLLDQENWEIAFEAVKSDLAPRPKPKNEIPASIAEEDVPAAPDNGTPANNGNKRLPASGIVPGSGQRPPAQKGRATMTPAEMRDLYRKNKAEFFRRQKANNWTR